MTDNHWSYGKSLDMANAMQTLNAKRVLIRAHCPWQNGQVERHNRTLQTEWAYRQVFTTNTARTQALAPRLHFIGCEGPDPDRVVALRRGLRHAVLRGSV